MKLIKQSYMIGLMFLAFAFANESLAQGADKNRRTSIDFEDELIEGEVRKPELFYLLQKKQFNFKRLIKLRTDFIPEMKKTAEEIRRSGS